MFHRHPSSMLIACAVAGVAAMSKLAGAAAAAGGSITTGTHACAGPSRVAIIDPQAIREPRRSSGAAAAKRAARKARNKRKR